MRSDAPASMWRGMTTQPIHVIGGGLAGSEAAYFNGAAIVMDGAYTAI